MFTHTHTHKRKQTPCHLLACLLLLPISSKHCEQVTNYGSDSVDCQADQQNLNWKLIFCLQQTANKSLSLYTYTYVCVCVLVLCVFKLVWGFVLSELTLAAWMLRCMAKTTINQLTKRKQHTKLFRWVNMHECVCTLFASMLIYLFPHISCCRCAHIRTEVLRHCRHARFIYCSYSHFT